MSEAPAYEEFGAYRLTHMLGKGGMASVYRAVRSGPMGFAKEVAIKRIHDALIDNEAILKGLINEARIGGQLKHPNIVEVYEFNKVGEAYYLAMEFVDGWTLDKVIKLSREFKMPVPPSVALLIGKQLCEGLEYAHTLESLDGQEVKLVHRDLKPANIILSRYGIAKIMDFGIAKAATNLFKTTLADVTKGTPHYMSPEQVAGAKDLTARSDLFALGALLYELVTGKVLFVGDALPTVLFNVVKAEVGTQTAEADERVPGLGDILEWLLRKDPTQRPGSAGEVGILLNRLHEDTHSGGPTIKQFLYSLRDRMMIGARCTADGGDAFANETMPSLEDEPEFATMLAPAQRPEPAVNEGLVEARRAADAAIGTVGKVFASTGALNVSTESETMAALPLSGSGLPEVGARVGLASAGAAPPFGTKQAKRKEIHPKPKAPRNIRKKKPKKRSSALMVVVAFLGLILAGTLGWIVKETVFATDPVESMAPALADSADLPLPVAENLTPAPMTEVASNTSSSMSAPSDPKPIVTPDLIPAPAAPAAPIGADATPISEPAPAAVASVAAGKATSDATSTTVVAAGAGADAEFATAASEPTPEAVPAPLVVAAAEPAATGRGTLKIKPSIPSFGYVWIDGIETGEKTPLMRFQIPAGKHTIQLVSERGRKSEPRVVVIPADGVKKLGTYDWDSKTWEY